MVHTMMRVAKVFETIPPYWSHYLNPLIDLFVWLYFNIVYAVFGICNYFQEKNIVKKPTNPITLLSASKLAEMIRKRELKSIDIVESYIHRIEEVNEVINAVAYRNYEEAREKAKEVDAKLAEMDDEELEEHCSSRPLLGLPFTMKDSISAAGKVITSGVWNRRETVENENAEVVQRMIDAGSFLLCITTVPQACLWIETNNAIHGRTNNPYDSRRMVGGSSGGEGALHGAGASLMGIGSDVGGSIRIPSFVNGIFGFVPTPGVVPLQGHIPNAPADKYVTKMARVGPMTRFAEDLELLTDVMSRQSIPAPSIETTFEKARIFFTNGLTRYKPIEPISWQTNESMKMAVQHFENKFNLIAHEIILPASEKACEFFFSSYKYFGDLPMSKLMNLSNDEVNCKEELFKYLKGTSHHSLIAIIQGLSDIEEPYTVEETEKIHSLRDTARKGLEQLLANDGLLFCPGFPTLASFHHESIFKQGSTFHTAYFNAMCLPAVQCPMGLSDQGLPTGVMIVGGPSSDRLLLKVAAEVSSTFGGWVSPGNLE